MTILHVAARNGNISSIVEAYNELKKIGKVYEKHVILNAVLSNNPDAVYTLSSYCGIPVTYSDLCDLNNSVNLGFSAPEMIKAISDCIEPGVFEKVLLSGDVRVLSFLSELKAGHVCSHLQEPILLATSGNNPEMIKYLLDHGYSVNGKDSKGRSAFVIACDNKNHQCARIIWEAQGFERGALDEIYNAILFDESSGDLTTLLKNNNTLKDKALYFSIENNKLDRTRDILNVGANPDSVLTTALRKGWDYVECLFEHNLSDKDKVLECAIKNRKLERMRDILNAGANADSALDMALETGWGYVEILLDHGADAYKALKYYCNPDKGDDRCAYKIATKYYPLVPKEKFEKLCKDLGKDENEIVSFLLDADLIKCEDCCWCGCGCNTCYGAEWYYDNEKTYEDLYKEWYLPCKPYSDTPGARVQPCGHRFHPESILDLVIASKRN